MLFTVCFPKAAFIGFFVKLILSAKLLANIIINEFSEKTYVENVYLIFLQKNLITINIFIYAL